MNAPRGRPTFKPVAVGAVDKVIASANPKRKGIIICNCDSVSTVYLAPNQPAVAGQGIALGPVYDDIELTEGDWGLLPGAEWHAVAALAGAVQGAQAPFTQLATAVDLSVAGTVLSQAVPAGSVGWLSSAQFGIDAAGAAALFLEIVRGGTTYVAASSTTAFSNTTGYALQAGDVVRWRVNTGAAGETGHFALSGWTATAAGAVPGTANVGVIELEG